MPEQLKEPELHDVEHYYWSAFWLLHTERQNGMGVWYIPYSKIVSFYNENKTGGDKDSFIGIIRAMDAVYVEHSNKKPDTAEVK